MGDTSHKIDGKQLAEKLSEQGFTVEDTTLGILVKSPDGERSTTVHRTYLNPKEPVLPTTMANLKRIGFDPAKEVSSTSNGKQETKENPELMCPECFELHGKKNYFTRPASLGAHRHKAHGYISPNRTKVPGKESHSRGVKVRYTTPESPAVRVRQAALKMKRAAETIAEQAEVVATEVETMYEDKNKTEAKLKKLETVLGKAVDQL